MKTEESVGLKEEQALENRYHMAVYDRKPVQFVSGEGMRLYDSDGNRYLDFLSGIGAVCLGHTDPAVTAAISAQAARLLHVSNYFYVARRGELAQELSDFLNGGIQAAPPWKLFFANSGAEANEGAIKLARKHGKVHLGGAGLIVSAKRSFHGRLLATTAATGQEAKQQSFTPLPAGFVQVQPGDSAALTTLLAANGQGRLGQKASGGDEAEAAFSHRVCAVLLECIQGEGGVWPLSSAWLQEVRTLTAEQDILLIIDEVQTGFCRTGANFSFMHAGICPDVVTLAKGIANGFPCAALAATGKAADILQPGEHGSTFGGSPLAIAAATATLQRLKELDLAQNAASMGTYLAERLLTLPHVDEVRGKGLMQAVVLKQPRAAEVAAHALSKGVVLANIGSSILRFLPPLIVTKQEVDEMIGILQDILEQL
jgi:acetylornithine aminotransferase